MSQKVFEKIIEILKDNQINYQLLKHEPVFTSEEAAKVRGTSIKQAAKALVFYADKMPIMIVLPGDKKIDVKKFKKAHQAKDLRMATPKEVEELIGVKIGAVHPLGMIHGLPVYVDNSLGKNQEVVFSAGLHTRSIKMKYRDWFRLAKPKLGNFSC